jgi:hypothetical protein
MIFTFPFTSFASQLCFKWLENNYWDYRITLKRRFECYLNSGYISPFNAKAAFLCGSKNLAFVLFNFFGITLKIIK